MTTRCHFAGDRMTTRRDTLVAFVAGALATPFASAAEGPLIGVLSPFHDEHDDEARLRWWAQELGFGAAASLRFDVRSTEGNSERLPKLAAELVARRPALIVTWGDDGARAVLAATTRIPIVVMTEDLLGAKFVASMHRPGGNLTGVSVMATELDAKRLEILAEVLPRRSNVLLLADRISAPLSRPAIRAVAQSLGLSLSEAIVSTPAEIESALSGARQRGIAGVNVLASPVLYDQSARIIALMAQHRLPAIYEWPFMAEQGGLLGYGPDIFALFRRFAGLMVKILQGAEVAELPVEQPTKFKLVINLKTAKALGITIPQSLLLRADEVIE